jgi:hypothetical protein
MAYFLASEQASFINFAGDPASVARFGRQYRHFFPLMG